MQTYKVDITEANAREQLIDESFKRPVLVDFWADWCGPCKSLMPILEKLAEEYAGDFLLAKVNADEMGMIAAQFGVRSLPTVMIIKDGRPIDGFVGAQPETEVRKLLDKYLPKPWDKQLAQGHDLLEAGDASAALAPLKEAYESSNQRADIACALADAYIQLNRIPEAQAVLDKIRLADQGHEYELVKAKLELAQNAQKAPEIQALEEQLAADPENGDVKFQLAVQYSQHGYHRDALELLHQLLQKNLNARDGEVRKIYTDVIAVLGKKDPLAVEYQRKLYSLLY
ncbi:thioredoxin [Saccharophagus sp. K07]|uniref:thioredoxin n=1 Tax=Saccharophagus sp. K07 TaxID=2283636 RepID=UPI001651D4F8|nr:thioredoxin [Saccharophagus sp. K07]